MSVKQKQRSIESMHQAAATAGISPLLEISTKSLQTQGIALSAFNLSFISQKKNLRFAVESVFQGSKVFENGGPFIDLYQASPRDAKRDDRLASHGRLVGFRFFKQDWPLEPRTAFYDWVYLNSLIKNPDLAACLSEYQAFSDIEFNPARSINCQAYSAALYCSLSARSLLDEALSSPEAFLRITAAHESPRANTENQSAFDV